jgi:predicted nucleotidyltransferase
MEEELGQRLRSVVLFGSVARGEADSTSDIDILIVAEGLPPSRLARQDVLAHADTRIEPDLERLRREGIWTDVLPIIKTPEEAARVTPLYLDMVEDAVLLVDRDGFFAGVLARLRESLRRLGARRVWQEGFWYWDLKPDYKPGEVFEI